MNEFMTIELSPNDGFYQWEELVEVVNAMTKLGWKVRVISVLGGYKLQFEKKLDTSKIIRKIIKTKQIGATCKEIKHPDGGKHNG